MRPVIDGFESVLSRLTYIERELCKMADAVGGPQPRATSDEKPLDGPDFSHMSALSRINSSMNCTIDHIFEEMERIKTSLYLNTEAKASLSSGSIASGKGSPNNLSRADYDYPAGGRLGNMIDR